MNVERENASESLRRDSKSRLRRSTVPRLINCRNRETWVRTPRRRRVLHVSSVTRRDGGLFARVKIERANNTLRQAEFIIRFAAERKIVKYSSRCMDLEDRIIRARAYRSMRNLRRSEKDLFFIIIPFAALFSIEIEVYACSPSGST